jgi:glucan phosphoethanolaminetransferase (alkaline phosphatase superfamily)
MKRISYFTSVAMLAAMPGTAMASDFTGFATLFIMLPLLVISLALAALLYLIRRRWPRFPTRWPSLILFTPVLALTVYVFFIDTVRAIPRIRPSDPDNFGLTIITSYVGAFIFLAYLGWLLVKSPGPSSRQIPADANTDAPAEEESS